MSEDWKFIKEVHSFKELPSDQIPEFIFWGRSNVGKSSLINSLTKKKIAKTSRTPGRTKSLVFLICELECNKKIIATASGVWKKINKKLI